MIWKEVVRSDLKHYPKICLEGRKKTMKNCQLTSHGFNMGILNMEHKY
jgi:hypothetical protein